MTTQTRVSSSRFAPVFRALLALLLLLSGLPGAALAAPSGEMDPDARTQAKQAAAVVGATLAGTTPPPATRPTGTRDPDTANPTSGETLSYSASGVTITVPDNWVVEESADEIFSLSVPGEFVFGFMDQEPAEEFPGVFAIVLFEQQSEMLAASMGDEMALQEVTRFQTDQGLPGLNIAFGGDMEGLEMGGSMYIVAAVDATYMLLVLGMTNVWETIQADADAIANSITADNPSMMISADTGDMDYISQDGSTSMIVPAGWQIQEIDDEEIDILLVDPAMDFVAAGTWEPAATIEDAADLALYEALISGTIGSEEEADVLTLLMASMDFGGDESEFVLDEASTALLGDADAPVLRVGATMTGDGFEMPMITYVKANEVGMVGLVTIGNQDRILDSEETLIGVLNSVVFQ